MDGLAGTSGVDPLIGLAGTSGVDSLLGLAGTWGVPLIPNPSEPIGDLV